VPAGVPAGAPKAVPRANRATSAARDPAGPPAPAKPAAGAVYDLVARANAWAAAYDACACRLGLVQRLLDGRPVGDPTQACPTVPAEAPAGGQCQAPAGAPEDPDPPPE
jgi:hypothetical protein